MVLLNSFTENYILLLFLKTQATIHEIGEKHEDEQVVVRYDDTHVYFVTESGEEYRTGKYLVNMCV